MKQSQYLSEYQTEALAEIEAGRKPYSIDTFLAYRLKGAAKNWGDQYQRSLVRGLEISGWQPVSSKLGGLAYAPVMSGQGGAVASEGGGL